jgi:hypothetical protein
MSTPNGCFGLYLEKLELLLEYDSLNWCDGQFFRQGIFPTSLL